MRTIMHLTLGLGLAGSLAGCPQGGDGSAVLLGGACDAFEDCAQGLVCAYDGICRLNTDPGTGLNDTPCVATTQCRIGLVCDAFGLCAEPGDPGTAGFDEACSGTDDCVFGLSCVDDVCKGLELPFWLGTTCPDPEEDDGPFRVYFEVPDGSGTTDFYRLPFPNDGRVNSGGQIDLSGHPTPGALIDVVGDVVGNVIRVAEVESEGGFGPNQAIFFRFTEYPDAGTLRLGPPGEGTVSLIDITPGEGGNALGYRFELASRATPYICHNWLAMHATDGRPLTPGHTYAAILGTGIRNDAGDPLSQDDHFAFMMSDNRPSDERIGHFWDAYAPLRTWLDGQSIARGTIAGAAVFTVGDPTLRPQLVHDAVQAAPVPAILPDPAPVLCGTDPDRFADASLPDRGCTPTHDAFDEVQLRVGLPRFQQGTAPYKDAGDGGDIDTSNGPPRVDGTQPVHLALTIPKGVAMPEAGWPVVLYAHGTGGNYTSVIRSGFAETHTAVTVGDDTTHLAMVGFDAPLHGPRANPAAFKQSWLDVDPHAYDPDVLFFNPLNVRAARDNPLQEAADIWSLVRFLGALDLSPEQSPTGQALRFDTSHILYVGHSQGGVVGPMALAWEPGIQAAVLSGAGGLIIRSFLEKTSPNSIPAALRVGLADPAISRVHPLLNLAAWVAEGTDGVNHARYLFRQAPAGFEAKHVLQTFGVGDTFSPDSTQYALARAAGMDQVPNGNDPLPLIGEVGLPATGNNSQGTTSLVVLYTATGSRDAHYVMFDRDDAKAHVSGFLGSAVLQDTPTVP